MGNTSEKERIGEEYKKNCKVWSNLSILHMTCKFNLLKS